MRKTLLLLTALAAPSAASAQSAIINEFSQGASGAKEWVEIVVIEDGANLQNWRLRSTNTNLNIALSGSGFSDLASGTTITIYNGGDVDATITSDLTYAPSTTNGSGDYKLVIASTNASGDYSLTRTAGWSNTTGAFSNSTANPPRLTDASDATVFTFPSAAYPSANQVSRFTGDTSSEAASSANWTVDASNTGTPGVANGGDNSTWITGLQDATTLPVELVSLTVAAAGSDALVRWTTASETNNAAFAVETLRNGAWREMASVAGRGTTSERADYEARVSGLGAGRHTLRLVQRDVDGTATVAGTVELVIGQTAAFDVAVRGNATASPEVSFVSRESGAAVVTVSDVTGRTVARYAVEASAGARTGVTVADLAAGVYVVRLESGRGSGATMLVVR